MRRVIKSPVKTLAIISAVLSTSVFFITAFWEKVSGLVFPNTKLGLYGREFWESFLVGMHGIIFELSIIALLVIWLDAKRNKNNDIERLKEDLDDYSSLDFPEINVKKLGHIKRLNGYGVIDIDIQNLVLNNLNVKGVEVEGARLIGLKIMNGFLVGSSFKKMKMRSSNFEGSTLKNTKFKNCDLLKSKYINAKCRGVDFTGSCLERADFTNADLQSSIFNQCNVREVKFEGANLKHAVFQDSAYLTAEILAKAKNLDYVKISEAIKHDLLKLRPDMKYQSNAKGRP
ncbi:pentapeptide repeat-containing protein [Halomonas sp. G11]|uniref:pentapeptide repeat-containing protein n=1 Tax=Halomonas sp. G11 TaxID=1684425 RepID=UPI000801F1F4|nr:pentapeptide repeat-containing protein [Halomonas sp. G11]OAZ99909.1 hypothetical protein ADS46_12530 [Halomonas sp. G11]